MQVQTAWRGKEVVKLAVHDEKSARKMNLPRFNLLLQELEEKTGGVLIDAAGASIWLYRCAFSILFI
jgi:RNA-binding protein YhbY